MLLVSLSRSCHFFSPSFFRSFLQEYTHTDYHSLGKFIFFRSSSISFFFFLRFSSIILFFVVEHHFSSPFFFFFFHSLIRLLSLVYPYVCMCVCVCVLPLFDRLEKNSCKAENLGYRRKQEQ